MIRWQSEDMGRPRRGVIWDDTAPQCCRRLSVLFAACLVLLGCEPAANQAPAPRPIRLGTYLWPGSYWIDVAWEKGWFREAGLNVERVDVDRRYFESQEDVVTGKLDAMGFSQFDLVRYVAAGHDLVGIAAIDYSDGAEELVARKDIRHLQDLKGKRLALHRGTYLEYLLAIVAERNSLDLAQVTLLDRSGDDSLEDFKAGSVDAVLVWEPYGTEALDAGGVVLFSSADFPGLTYSLLTLRRDFIDAHPDQVAALVRVWDRAERYVREHPDDSCEIVARLFHESLQSTHDLMRTVRVLDLADNDRAFSYAAGFESLHGSWRRMNDFMQERGLVTARVDSQTHLDSDFIRLLQ
jgi:NitT/TauT family transport system substrate-binding protein